MGSGSGVLVIIIIVCWIVVAYARSRERKSKSVGRGSQRLPTRPMGTIGSTAREVHEAPSGPSDRDRDLVTMSAQSIVRVVNESLQIAANTKNEETRRSRLAVARTKLAELDRLTEQFPFIRPTDRDAVQGTIEALETQVKQREREPTSHPVEAEQGVQGSLPGWSLQKTANGSSGFIKGWRFAASLQRHTPLAILKMHGTIVRGLQRPSPDCSTAYGNWLLITKAWEDPSANVDLARQLDSLWLSRGLQASDVGEVPVDGGEYLPFLIALRTIFESEDTVEFKVNRIQALGDNTSHARYLRLYAEQNPNWLLDMFASVFSVIPGIGHERAHVLFRAGFRKLADLDAASDDSLDKLEGFGPKIIRSIRQYRASASDRDDGTAAIS